TRGYPSISTLKLVGDRYALQARQRVAVARCAVGEDARERRQKHEIQPADLPGQELWIDGYNVLTSLEAALAGGAILHARDGCYRDMASMHGSYRKVAETTPAILAVGELLTQWQVASCHWLLDRPVSNSGRLRAMLLNAAASHGWPWHVELVPDPDPLLANSAQVV